MSLLEWILGVLFRPGTTFERARDEMTLSYWWILLSVATIEAVQTLYHPATLKAIPALPSGDIVFNVLVFLLLVFGAQVICLFWAGRLLGWPVEYHEAAKYTGLIWSLFLLEDLVTFYPFLTEQNALLFWLALPFLLWRLAAQAAGVRRVSGLPWPRAILITILATLPWQLPLLYLNFSTLLQS